MIPTHNSQKISDGSISFTRHYCKEGFIDKWMGSSSTSPNRKEYSPLEASKFSTYYRLNGQGQWIQSSEFFGVFNALISREALQSINAYELWHRCKKLRAKVAC